MQSVVTIESPPEITGESFIAQSEPLSSDSMTPVLTNEKKTHEVV